MKITLSWLNNIRAFGVFVFCVFLSACCIGEKDYHRLLTPEEAAWVPDSSLTSFIMQADNGLIESYVLISFIDTVSTLINNCNVKSVDQRRQALYYSTFHSHHNIEISISTTNETRLDIRLNWYFNASWDMDRNKQIPNRYADNNYPNPVQMSIINNKNLKGHIYPEVLNIQFSASDVEENGIIQANFIPEYGIVHYELKNGVAYFRNPMP